MLKSLERPSRANAYLFLTLTMMLWAGNYIAGRWSAGQIPPITLSCARWMGAALVILPFAWRHIERDWAVIRANVPVLLLLGVVGNGVFNTLQYIALNSTSATTAGIFNSATPVLIVLMSFVLNGERVRPLQLAGIATSLAGVLTVVAKGSLATLAMLELNRGDLIMLGAVAIWALYTALLDKRPKLHPLTFAALTYVVAATINVPPMLWELSSGPTITLSTTAVLVFLYVALLPSLVANLFFNRGVEILGPATSGAFLHLVPGFTAVLAMLFLGERPQLYHGLGFVLILLGVWLAARGRSAT